MSHLEIERKFLVASDSWRREARASTFMRQGYLTDERHCSVRVRIEDEAATLNIKSATIGAQRLEFEYDIPLLDAHRMLDALSCKPLIQKVRFYIDVGVHTWEIDVFQGDNAGLIVAEIELDHPDEPFDRPGWLGEEVTEDIRYYNTCLASNPYRNWQNEPIA
jgi:adenylate cyclase